MMENIGRGNNFTSAFLGIKCDELHVCGEPRMLNILKILSNYCEDDFKVINYERKNKLLILNKPIKLKNDLKKGDCVIGFSKNILFKSSNIIKNNYNEDSCFIYGKLPPEIKLEQTHKFNNKENSFLVATDAVI